MKNDKKRHCVFCGIKTCLTEHHLTPKSRWEYFPVLRDVYKTITLCLDCHRFVHQQITPNYLGWKYYTEELLKEHTRIADFIIERKQFIKEEGNYEVIEDA